MNKFFTIKKDIPHTKKDSKEIKIMQEKNNKRIIIIIIGLIIVLLGILFWNFFSTTDLSSDIIKYELQTPEYFSNAPRFHKYVIDSKSELKKFYSIYSDELNIDENYLDNNKIFIEVKEATSGSIKMSLSSVKIQNSNVVFDIKVDSPQYGGTDDMAFWYFVAIIPKEKVNNLSLLGWKKPSSVIKNK